MIDVFWLIACIVFNHCKVMNVYSGKLCVERANMEFSPKKDLSIYEIARIYSFIGVFKIYFVLSSQNKVINGNDKTISRGLQNL